MFSNQHERNKVGTPSQINDTNVEVDSGSLPNTRMTKSHPPLSYKRSTVRIFACQADNPIDPIGKFETQIHANGYVEKANFQVIMEKGKNLLSRNTSERLNLLRVGPLTPSPETAYSTSTPAYIQWSRKT